MNGCCQPLSRSYRLLGPLPSDFCFWKTRNETKAASVESKKAAAAESGMQAAQDAGEKESTEAKKKHKKKKGGHAKGGNANGKDVEEDPKTEQRSLNEPSKGEAGLEDRQKSSEAEGPDKDADAQLRAEFQEAFEGAPTPAGSKSKKAERPEKVLAGTDLLQELESLRSGTEALEARMAERLQARVNRADGDDPDSAKPNAAAAARRRKKMFV
eukprot:s1458_g6.t2